MLQPASCSEIELLWFPVPRLRDAVWDGAVGEQLRVQATPVRGEANGGLDGKKERRRDIHKVGTFS